MNVRTHTFNGVRYNIEIGPFFGLCDPPGGAAPAISLPLGLPYADDKDAEAGLRALLHECIHAERWTLPEEVVERTCKEVTRLMWRLGYRRVKPKKKKGR